MVEDGGEIVSLEDVFKECNDIEEKRLNEYLKKSKFKTEKCVAKRLDKAYFEKRFKSSNNDSITESNTSFNSSIGSSVGSWYSYKSGNGSILKRNNNYKNKNSSNYYKNFERYRDYRKKNKNNHSFNGNKRDFDDESDQYNGHRNFRRVHFSRRRR
jgi:hypothetical protein